MTYPSSISGNITNLYAEVSMPTNRTGLLPISIWIHGFPQDPSGGATNIGVARRTPMATNGLFVVSPGLRGRDFENNGWPDTAAYECYDVADLVTYILRTYVGVVDPENITIAGYSGGGGIAAGVAMKHPDLGNLHVSYFGMYDYLSWGWENSLFGMADYQMGQTVGNPTTQTVTNYYLSRNSMLSLPINAQGGFFMEFHNLNDSTVQYDQAQGLTNSFFAAGNTRLFASNSATLFEHTLPGSGTGFLPDAWGTVLRFITNGGGRTWSVPATGHLDVASYVKTKLFEVQLDTGTNGWAGLDYDAIHGDFTVTPTNSMTLDVRITYGGVSSTNTVSSPTLIHMGTIAAPSGVYSKASETTDHDGYTEHQLNWTDNATNETHYVIDVSTNSVDYYLLDTLAANAQAVDTLRVTWASNLWFRVRAINDTGTSAPSAPYHFVGNMPVVNFTAASSATNVVSFTWESAGGYLTGYVIEQDTSPSFEGLNLLRHFVAGQATTSLVLTDQFALNTTYYFRIKSVSAGGDGEALEKPRPYIAMAPNGPPTAPLLISTHMSGTAGASVTTVDDTAPNRTGWLWQASTNGGSTWTTLNATESGGVRQTFDHAGMIGGVTYLYRLAATNSIGSSDYLTWTFIPPATPIGTWHAFHVSTNSTGNGNFTGTNDANAWAGLGGINWPILTPGDIVYIDGGVGGITYSNYLVTFSSGVAGNPIVIKTSTNANHNGHVNIYGQVAWKSDYVVVDGARDGAFTLGSTPQITNNIGLTVFGRADLQAGVYQYHAVGSVLKWVEVRDIGYPGIGEGDCAGIRYGDFNGPTNAEIAYCWVHDVFGNAILGNVNAGSTGLGNMKIHHNLLERWHNNMVGGQGSSDFYENYATGYKAPLVAHPDGVEGDITYFRAWNNHLFNIAPPSGSGLYFGLTQITNAIQIISEVNGQAVPTMVGTYPFVGTTNFGSGAVLKYVNYSSTYVIFQDTNTVWKICPFGQEPTVVYGTSASIPSGAWTPITYGDVYPTQSRFAPSIYHDCAIVNNIFGNDTESCSHTIGQSGNPFSLMLSNVVIAGNAFWSGDSFSQFVITTGSDNNWEAKNIVLANNIFLSSSNASGSALFSSGKIRYANQSDFMLDYNLIGGTSKLIAYRTNNAAVDDVFLFPNAEAFNAWSIYKSNSSASPHFISPSSHNFSIYGMDTNAIDRGTNLSSWSWLIPAITNDINGSPRGQNGRWDIGPAEHDPSQLMFIDFETFTNGAGSIAYDMSGHNINALSQTNRTVSDVWYTNYCPGVVAGRIGARAGNFGSLGTNEQYLRHLANLGYGQGTPLGITNIAPILYLTNGTFAFWINSTNLDGLQDATIWSGAWSPTDFSWGVSRYGWSGLTFERWSNGVLRAEATIPDNLIGTNEWHHVAGTWNAASNLFMLYLDGLPIQTNTMEAPYFTLFPDAGNVVVDAMAFGLDYTDFNGHPNNGWFSGYLDEIVLHDRALSRQEVLNLASGDSATALSSPSNPPETPPVARRPRFLNILRR